MSLVPGRGNSTEWAHQECAPSAHGSGVWRTISAPASRGELPGQSRASVRTGPHPVRHREENRRVGAPGFEPGTPALSAQCSALELCALLTCNDSTVRPHCQPVSACRLFGKTLVYPLARRTRIVLGLLTQVRYGARSRRQRVGESCPGRVAPRFEPTTPALSAQCSALELCALLTCNDSTVRPHCQPVSACRLFGKNTLPRLGQRARIAPFRRAIRRTLWAPHCLLSPALRPVVPHTSSCAADARDTL